MAFPIAQHHQEPAVLWKGYRRLILPPRYVPFARHPMGHFIKNPRVS